MRMEAGSKESISRKTADNISADDGNSRGSRPGSKQSRTENEGNGTKQKMTIAEIVDLISPCYME